MLTQLSQTTRQGTSGETLVQGAQSFSFFPSPSPTKSLNNEHAIINNSLDRYRYPSVGESPASSPLNPDGTSKTKTLDGSAQYAFRTSWFVFHR